MKTHYYFILCRLAIALTFTARAFAAESQQIKLMFLKDSEVNVANADGTNAKKLTNDGVSKSSPKWSPDGRKIAYLINGESTHHPKSYARVVVITPEGKGVNTLPVLKTEKDGSEILGLRAVEELGWFNDTSVYVSGSINPSTAEYRVLDISSGDLVRDYFGSRFSTCADVSSVAYLSEVAHFSNIKSVDVEVNGSRVYPVTGKLPWQDFTTGLVWSNDCISLGFIQREESPYLVVVRKKTPQEPIRVSASVLQSLSLRAIERGFVLSGGDQAYFYDSATRLLQNGVSQVQELNSTRDANAAVVKRVNGESPDWWPKPKK